MGCHPKPIDELHHFFKIVKTTTNQIGTGHTPIFRQTCIYRHFLKWGTPKSSILRGCSILNHPAIGVSPFLDTPHVSRNDA